MSRWTSEFRQHPFHAAWKSVVEECTAIDVTDKTVVADVEELARLKKAIAFLNGLISLLDPELVPKSVWPVSQPQAETCLTNIRNYASTQAGAQLRSANDAIDNLLSYIRPYVIAPDRLPEVHLSADSAFTETMTASLRAFDSSASVAKRNIEETLQSAAAILSQLTDIRTRVVDLSNEIFEGSSGDEAIEVKVKDYAERVQTICRTLESVRADALDGPESKIQQITVSHTEASRIVALLRTKQGDAEKAIGELETFHTKIFGKQHDDDEVRDGGLDAELTARFTQLTELEAAQRTKHAALVEQIESLLPGATSAGLATAYKALRDSFASPVRRYTQVFYGSLTALFVCAAVMTIENITFFPFTLQLVQASDWDAMVRTLLVHLPLAIPIVWFALYSATRRSQYERLQQEYAHKEALAASYESYKKQLQDLNIETSELQRELIAKAIDAISYNASKSLDGNHAEKLPFSQVLEKLSLDEVKKLVDLARGK